MQKVELRHWWEYGDGSFGTKINNRETMRTWHQTFATSWIYLYKPHINYIHAIEISLKNYQCVETGQQYSFIWSGSGLLRPLRWGTPQNLLAWPIHIHHVLFKQSTRAEMGDLIQRIWKFDSHKDMRGHFWGLHKPHTFSLNYPDQFSSSSLRSIN